ncbi:hypothetical protein D9M71_167790 [compost metagenome]
MHRRDHGGAADAVVDGLAGGGDLRQFGACLVEFLEGVGAERQSAFLHFPLDLRNRGLGAGNGQVGGFQLAAGFHGAALQAEDFHLGDGAGLHQRLGHVQLLLDQPQAGAVLLALGAEFGQLLLLLPQLFAEDALLAFQALVACAVERLLVFGQLRRVAGDLLGQGHFAALGLGGQAFHPGHQRQAVSLGLALVGEEAGVVQTQQDVALVHHLALAYEDFRDDAALQVLDDLHLAGRNRLAFASGDFLQHGEVRPGQRHQQQGAGHPDGNAGRPWRVFHHGAGDFRHELGVGAIAAAEVGMGCFGAGHAVSPQAVP